jgi:hypothetical protein
VFDRRVIVVALSWLAISFGAFQNPVLMVFAWPMTGIFLLWALLGSTADLRAAMPLREPLVISRRLTLTLRGFLAVLAGSAVVGTVTSVIPSMAFRDESGATLYTYGLSIIIGPLLWMTVFATAVRALRHPAPRRLAISAIVTLIAWPLLLGIRAAREPWLDLDNQFLVLAPHVLSAYVAAAVVASGAAIALAFKTARLARGPVVVAPPRATILAAPPRVTSTSPAFRVPQRSSQPAQDPSRSGGPSDVAS